MSFPDHFSARAAAYAAFRPRYPAALFDWLATLAPAGAEVWDCATGSGQAAVALAERVGRVTATDASAAQVAHAEPHPRVTYAVAPAEASGLADASVDLVTVAQALHWFDLDAFWREARRVLRPGGAIAVWSYGDAVLEAPALDAAYRRFYGDVLGPYWPRERARIGAAYLTMPFPFAELPAPTLDMSVRWHLADLAGYVRTWSAVTRYVAEHEADPVPLLERALAPLWGDGARVVRWPLTV
ncbi:MAG: class I SAM-dependent methyltransferase, partial [Gemmatimonadaceae bacterium]